MNFAEYLKKDRNRKMLSQAEYSKWLGVSTTSLNKYETGKLIPICAVRKSICKKLKLTNEEMEKLVNGSYQEEK